MILVLDRVLERSELSAMRLSAERLEFGDGKSTAGRYARSVKANAQAVSSPDLEAIETKVMRKLAANPVFQSAARPRAMSKLIVSRYRIGQTYGLHVDDALMSGVRTDLSFTLFLSEPDEYDGGALIIEETSEERAFRPAAGDLLLYPSTTLHRVEPVTRGVRYAVVGWVQSWIRSAEKREILFDLDRSVEAAHGIEGQRVLFETLAKTRSNLVRMWAGD
jgi:PKHD-type hydroxylase